MSKDKFSDYDSTSGNNTDIGGIDIQGTTVVQNFDNAFRELMAQTADHYSKASVASAATVDLGAQAAQYIQITGTTTITSFGTVKAGTTKFVRFSGALTLTYNATSLILPGGANITTASGDTAIFVSEGSGNWRCVSYSRLAPGSGLYKMTVHTSSTTHNYDAATTRARIRVWGAGGGGRSIDNSSATLSGPGGGGGGYCEKIITNPPSSATITIGAAGSAGSSGGNSSYSDGTTTLTANGGGSGATITSSGLASGGSGGNGTGGTVNISGGKGEETLASSLNRSGSGGTPAFAVGAPGWGSLRSTTSADLNASGYGAGGAGANSGGVTATRQGGSGSPGLVIIEEYR